MLEIRSPYDFSLIENHKMDSMGDMLKKVEKAQNFFKETQRQNSFQMMQVLEKSCALLRDHTESFALTIAKEGGKPLKDAKVEVERARQGIQHIMSEVFKLSGREIPMGFSASSQSKRAFTIREPKGLVVAISAFNHPLNLIVHQVVPAIAVGCPVIIKPDLRTPLSCIKFLDLLKEAGLPEAACQLLICDNFVAEELVKNKHNTFLNFIGSESVGWHLRSLLPKGAGCVLEHGGAAPLILDSSADLNIAVPGIVKGGFYHAGQVCVSVQRVFIHEDILSEVCSRLVEETKNLKVGDPLEIETDVGPLIEPSQVDRVADWVKQSGGEILCGGDKKSQQEYLPTLILEPDSSSKVSTEEIFGPVICLYSFKDLREAIKRANSVEFAFQSSLYSNDHKNIMFFVDKIAAQTVLINEHTAFRVDWMPFGGFKKSGLGVGGFEAYLKDLTVEKLIVLNEVR